MRPLQNLPKAHSDFAASASDRWLFNCPASVKACRGLKSEESFASMEGSAAHELAAVCLQLKVSPLQLRLGTKIPDKYVSFIDDDMRREVARYYDFCLPYFDRGEVFIESKFDLAWIDKKRLSPMHEIPGKNKFTMYGTGDFVVVEPFGDIHVIDLKFGRGKIVQAENNSQLAFYGIGAADIGKWDFNNIHMSIFQPRREHFPTWTLHREKLLDWVDKFRAGVEASTRKDAEFKPGKHCDFCPAKNTCEARLNATEDYLIENFNLPASQGPKGLETLSSTQLSDILKKADVIKSFLKDVEMRALQMLERGEAVPGFKLVNKKGTRTWKDVEKLAAHCKRLGYDEMFTEPELKSPAQAEKILGKKFVEKHAVLIASSGSSIVPDSDRRSAKQPSVDITFDD